MSRTPGDSRTTLWQPLLLRVVTKCLGQAFITFQSPVQHRLIYEIYSEFVCTVDKTISQNATPQRVCHDIKTNNFYAYINISLNYTSVLHKIRFIT